MNYIEEEVLKSGDSRIEEEYVIELVQENPGISAFHRYLLTSLTRVRKSGKIAGRLRHGVMRYYTVEYIEKYNL